MTRSLRPHPSPGHQTLVRTLQAVQYCSASQHNILSVLTVTSPCPASTSLFTFFHGNGQPHNIHSIPPYNNRYTQIHGDTLASKQHAHSIHSGVFLWQRFCQEIVSRALTECQAYCTELMPRFNSPFSKWQNYRLFLG